MTVYWLWNKFDLATLMENLNKSKVLFAIRESATH